MSKKLNVFDKIKFLWEVTENDLPDYLNLVDVFVSTLLVDSGLAANVTEAIACGILLVVSDSGDNKLFIKDGENGFIFPSKNRQILAEKVIRLLEDEKL